MPHLPFSVASLIFDCLFSSVILKPPPILKLFYFTVLLFMMLEIELRALSILASVRP